MIFLALESTRAILISTLCISADKSRQHISSIGCGLSMLNAYIAVGYCAIGTEIACELSTIPYDELMNDVIINKVNESIHMLTC